MSFSFLIPKSYRGSSEASRGDWRAVSVFSVPKSVLRAPDPSFAPPVDVYETEDEVVVRMEIAGIDPAAIDIMIMRNERLVTIRGKRRDPAAGQPRNYHNMEIECGLFSRQIRLPADVDETQAAAHYSDGFLVVALPKAKSPGTSAQSEPID